MERKSIYFEGHLVVAAIRILEHRGGSPPALDQICELLKYSSEQAAYIIRRLGEDGIIKQVEGVFDGRWTVADHLKLEELPQDSAEPTQLDHALQKFQAEKNKMALKVEAIKEQQALKKKDLFAELEKKIKKDIAKK
jgi:DNA-binding Lrp family transcriptional regulator